MKANWEKTDKNQGVLEVEVDAEEVAKALDQAFKKVVKKVNVPGFRRGKVPRRIFEAKFGVEALYQDALDILLSPNYAQAVEETGIEPVAQPEVDIEQMEKGKPLIFKATVIVKPEVELGQYKGLEVTVTKHEVTAQDVEDELKRMQERHAEMVVLDENQPIERGDTAIIDFEGFQNGEAFEGGQGENYSLEIGSNTFIPGFEDQLIGMKKGEEKEIQVTFPEAYHVENLAGKEAVFKVKVNDIKRKQLPALDDEFAKDVSEFDTLEELKQDVENRLKEDAEHTKKHEIENNVLEKVAENATIDIPQPMLDHEIDHMVQDFARQIQMQGLNLELYLQFSGLDEAGLREQFKENAEKRVRIQLVLEKVGQVEDIKASDEEVEAELNHLAEMYNRPVDEIRQLFTAQDNLEQVARDVQTRKTVEFLVENNTIVETEPVEESPQTEEEPAESAAEAEEEAASEK
jgi:trigger factor